MAWKQRQAKIRKLAEGLVKIGALQFGAFTLPDGRDSSYLVNLRGLPSYPGTYKMVVDSISDLVASKSPKAEAFCTAPLSGLVLAAPIAVATRKPLIYTRPHREGERVVEGEVRPGCKVTVIDDLTASGRTILSAARAVGLEGGEVRNAVVLIDRLEGARERLSKEGIALHSFTDIMELADTLLAMELIEEHDLKAITKAVGRR